MNPAVINAAIQGIIALISAAPKIEGLVRSGKEFIQQMFSAGLITQAQQEAIWNYADAKTKLIESGIIPPAWQVEPDE